MRFGSSLDDVHAHLAQAVFALVQAREEDPELDAEQFARVAKALTDAQELLLKLTSDTRRRSAAQLRP